MAWLYRHLNDRFWFFLLFQWFKMYRPRAFTIYLCIVWSFESNLLVYFYLFMYILVSYVFWEVTDKNVTREIRWNILNNMKNLPLAARAGLRGNAQGRRCRLLAGKPYSIKLCFLRPIKWRVEVPSTNQVAHEGGREGRYNGGRWAEARVTAILPFLLILPKNPAKATLAGFSGRIGKA